MEIKVLYKDKHVLIVSKPVGVLSEESPKGGETITQLMSKQTGGYVGLVHRLDRITGGVMLLSCNEKTVGKLCNLVASGDYEKEYMAVIDGKPEKDEDFFDDLLYFDRKSSKSFIVSRPRNGVKDAKLSYKIIETVKAPAGEKTLVAIKLYTGRTHQIRAQFASRKLPLTGDVKYGSRDGGCRCALWSAAAKFIHPITKEEISVKDAPPTEEYPWNLFKTITE